LVRITAKKGEKNQVIVFYYPRDLSTAARTKNILFWVPSWFFLELRM